MPIAELESREYDPADGYGMPQMPQTPPMQNINTAEIYPVDYKVLIKLDEVEEKSSGGIIMSTGQATEREQMAQVRGTLIARGGNAFQDWKGTRPEPGMRVMLAKYAGLFCEGYDGEEYRLCNDKDVAAILGRENRGPKHDQHD